MYSLLDDALFQTETHDGPAAMTLPGVLRALHQDDLVSFDALQAHQQQAWYSFLVQLAAMAVVRAHDDAMPESAEAWRGALLGLAGGNENAWRLMVDDLDEPAFLQPPVPEGSLSDAKFKDDVPSPSSLDVLVTSKNHDVKQQRITDPHPEHWIYALVTLQTMEGFLGRGNYGIVRMNGGFGNRPFVGLSPSLSPGARFQRDLKVLADQHEELDTLYDPKNGKTLLWIDSWDGSKEDAVKLRACDPYFIEVCRRIRFTHEGGRLVCWRANTKGQRVDAPSSLQGRTEDPWTPVDEEKALTLGGSGFTYRKLQQILFGAEYARPAALRPHEEDAGPMYVTAQAMVRGQGKTEGLHHRIVPVPEEVRRLFAREETLEMLSKRAKQRVTKADEVESNVLRPAVAALLSGGREGQVDWEQVQPWIDAFDDAVDDRFFEALWQTIEKQMSDEEAAQQWEALLFEEAVRQFEEAQEGVPLPDIRRWRAISAARSIFNARIHQVLDNALSPSASA
ncbi:MAG: type I-E CRISPR-associated protein Cse1/CasA [Bacteroidetes bacterium]|jgi:CRISPR system Cascade subunit CasA|nr:type I-E CRISPR-associated protein Cse1/CasA [Bacteroidota bacterium]